MLHVLLKLVLGDTSGTSSNNRARSNVGAISASSPGRTTNSPSSAHVGGEATDGLALDGRKRGAPEKSVETKNGAEKGAVGTRIAGSGDAGSRRSASKVALLAEYADELLVSE